MTSSRPRLTLLALCVAAASLWSVAPARATFPGANGQIAFGSEQRGDPRGSYVINPDGTGLQRVPISGQNWDPAWAPDGTDLAYTSCEPDQCGSNTDIYRIHADGTGATRLTTNPGNAYASAPSWSPDGSKIAFTCGCGGSSGVWVMNADGSNQTRLVSGEMPDWSPDGTKIAFEYSLDGFFTISIINPDGTGLTPVTTGNYDFEPSWSPDGSRLAFARFTGYVGTCPYSCYPIDDIFTVNADGTGLARLTDRAPDYAREPTWSPDGKKIAFSDESTTSTSSDIWTMNADGSGQTNVTSDAPPDRVPSWGRVPPGYPRPKGATPVRVPLVVAYKSCTTPNQAHGGPLATGSCNPPVQASQFLTVGTQDANGASANSTGSLRLDVFDCPACASAITEDVRIHFSLSDVRDASDLSDYRKEIDTRIMLRITDRASGPAANEKATLQDLPFSFAVPCTGTSDKSIGSSCTLVTSVESLLPGAIKQTHDNRAIWELGQVQVYDGGARGVAGASDATLFMDEGLFAP